MYDCTVRAVGSCLVSFGSLVYLQDAGSTGDGARELANVATHCFCTPSLTFEFLFFLFVFGQVIVLCHCFSFTPLWISYGVWHRHERIECMVWSQMSVRPYLVAGCKIFERFFLYLKY